MPAVERIDVAQSVFDVVIDIPQEKKSELYAALTHTRAQITTVGNKIRVRFDASHQASAKDLRVAIGGILDKLRLSGLVEWQILPIWSMLVLLDSKAEPAMIARISRLIGERASIVWQEESPESFIVVLYEEPPEDLKYTIKRAVLNFS